MKWEFNFISYNAIWRRCRRTFHNYFHPGVVTQYRPFHIRAARNWLFKLLEDPENPRVHARR